MAQTKAAKVRKRPGSKACISCGWCNANCNMDVDIMGYISTGRRGRSSEYILCGKCSNICTQRAIR